MTAKRPVKKVSDEELRQKWRETADSSELGFYVGVAGEPINDIIMPRWALVREADGPEGIALYEDEFGYYFAVADDDGPYASLIRLE